MKQAAITLFIFLMVGYGFGQEVSEPGDLPTSNKQNVKFNINDLGFAFGTSTNGLTNLVVDLSYERSLNRSFSVQGGILFGATEMSSTYTPAFHSGFELSGRFYHLAKKAGRPLMTGGYISTEYNWIQTQRRNYFDTDNMIHAVHSQISLLYGWQFDIGQKGFIDINVGPAYQIGHDQFKDNALIMDFNFGIGLGF
ncbi:hypothetical protein KFE98_04135 [bacterium SCSIO 12741]|nr:hypothetical protein KFE98_04135 [bacterium SCSIO 12741]